MIDKYENLAVLLFVIVLILAGVLLWQISNQVPENSQSTPKQSKAIRAFLETTQEERWVLSGPISAIFDIEDRIEDSAMIPVHQGSKGVRYFAVFKEKPIEIVFSLDYLLEREANLPDVFVVLTRADSLEIVQETTISPFRGEYHYISEELEEGFYDIWIAAEEYMIPIRVRVEVS